MPDAYGVAHVAPWIDSDMLRAVITKRLRYLWTDTVTAIEADPEPEAPSYPSLEARGFVFPQDLEQRSEAGLVLLPERCSACGRKHEPMARASR